MTAACSHKNSIKIYENCAVRGQQINSCFEIRDSDTPVKNVARKTQDAASFATIYYRWPEKSIITHVERPCAY